MIRNHLKDDERLTDLIWLSEDFRLTVTSEQEAETVSQVLIDMLDLVDPNQIKQLNFTNGSLFCG